MSRTFFILMPLVIGLVVWGCEQEEPGEVEPGAADTTEQASTSVEPAGEMATPPDTPEAKIDNATSAGPEEIAANATVMDWPAAEGAEMTELRAGTNGWTCMPDVPNTPGNDPMCLDQVFLQWASAWQSRQTPQIDGVGLGYMLQGGTDASNSDPYATAPAPGDDWVKAGPHVMMVTPDVAQLEALPTDPANGGPWVMWKGTPYAHIMMPVEGAE